MKHTLIRLVRYIFQKDRGLLPNLLGAFLTLSVAFSNVQAGDEKQPLCDTKWKCWAGAKPYMDEIENLYNLDPRVIVRTTIRSDQTCPDGTHVITAYEAALLAQMRGAVGVEYVDDVDGGESLGGSPYNFKAAVNNYGFNPIRDQSGNVLFLYNSRGFGIGVLSQNVIATSTSGSNGYYVFAPEGSLIEATNVRWTYCIDGATAPKPKRIPVSNK